MYRIIGIMNRLTRDERGATIVEYGVALTIVIAVAVATLTAIAADVNGQFTSADGMM